MRRRTPLLPAGSQAGLTLVELLIGMALGLLVVGTLGYLYAGNRQAFRVQDNVARLQENGRYAVEVMGQDLRMGGYMGCSNLAEVTVAPTAVVVAPVAVPNPANVLGGVEGGAGADSLTLMRVDGRGAVLTAVMTDAAAAVPIPPSPRQHAAGTYFLVADCLNADIFRASGQIVQGATTIQHAENAATTPPNTVNTSNNLSKAYGADALVFPFEALAYSIGNNPAGNPALYRAVNGTAQEVVENVKDMQIVYGVDTDGDGAVNAYVTANNVVNWAQVLAVRVSLLLRSPEANVATGPPAVFWDRDNNGVNDFNPATDADAQARRLLYVYTSTIGLRNRLR
jgi:type IV pilus assembly protein PilW